jgi:hypothetical protein
MRIHNLYTDSSGQSHFRDIEVEWVEETRGGKLSKRLPATGIIFREVPPNYDLDWHPAQGCRSPRATARPARSARAR